MADEKSKKRLVISNIFNKLFSKKPNQNYYIFDNSMVKEESLKVKFSNQFDATKYDSMKLLPPVLKEKGYFIIHLGKGNHAFVKGKGYHTFEPIQETVDWPIKMSIFNKIGTSEASTVSDAFNTRIIHDFIFGDVKKELFVHTARRSKTSFDLEFDGDTLHADKLQIEIDGFYESEDTVVCVEAKNIEHEDFEIRQVHSTMIYFYNFQKEGIIPKNYNIRFLFIVRVIGKIEDSFRIYEYKFDDVKKLDSIKLIKNKQYNVKYD
jgi:hypothetical protein